jgi:hypothetical protein
MNRTPVRLRAARWPQPASPTPAVMPRRTVASPSPPPKDRLGSIYLTRLGMEALTLLVAHHGMGPSGTIDAVLREAAAALRSTADNVRADNPEVE